LIVEILPIAAMAFKEVRYYTVRLENREVSEFYDFQKRMSEYNSFELAEINRYIQNIGSSYGGAQEGRVILVRRTVLKGRHLTGMG
jgi:hypothetical protein